MLEDEFPGCCDEDPIEELKQQLLLGRPVDGLLVAQLQGCVRRDDWDACAWLSLCYMFGVGVAKDAFVADALLELSIARGSKEMPNVEAFAKEIAPLYQIAKTLSEIEHGGSLRCDFPADFTVIDIETTGFSQRKDDITEFAALRVRNGKVVDEFQELVWTDHPISDVVANKTHITNEMLKSARPIQQVLPAFLDFIKDDTLVGFNIEKFDIGFICCKTEDVLGRSILNDIIDLLPMLRHQCPGWTSYKLDDVRVRLELDCEGAHRAMKDCIDTWQLFEWLKGDVEAEETEFQEALEAEEKAEEEVYESLCIPEGFKPLLKPEIPISYKERWDYVRNIPFKSFASANVVITGDGPAMPRWVAEHAVVELGAQLKKSATRDCDFCVVLEQPGSTKVEAAKKWMAKGSPIQILDLEGFKAFVKASIEEPSR